MPRRPAFIAAPLIGTIIFLTAVVFVVNLSKTEAQTVSRIGDDAYHNRVVSLLELYRSDLYGLFSDGLRQNAEDFLAGIRWIGLNDVTKFSEGERLAKCNYVSEVLYQQLASSGTSKDEGFLNGLSDLMGALRSTYTFEGITFRPVTFIASTSYGNIPWDFNCNVDPGYQICKQMLPRNSFDCKNYATDLDRPYRCCEIDTGTSGADCPADRVIPGCENGNFYLKVNMENPDVFKAMPRIEARDSIGNVIRSNALGESNFLIPIRYPIFKYNDASFRLFAFQQYFSEGNRWAGASSAPSSAPAVPHFSKSSYRAGIAEACDYFHTPGGLFSSLGFNVTYYGTGDVACRDGSLDGLDNLDNSAILLDGRTDLRLDASIADQDPRFRVNKDNPNAYAVSHKMAYAPP